MVVGPGTRFKTGLRRLDDRSRAKLAACLKHPFPRYRSHRRHPTTNSSSLQHLYSLVVGSFTPHTHIHTVCISIKCHVTLPCQHCTRIFALSRPLLNSFRFFYSLLPYVVFECALVAGYSIRFFCAIFGLLIRGL